METKAYLKKKIIYFFLGFSVFVPVIGLLIDSYTMIGVGSIVLLWGMYSSSILLKQPAIIITDYELHITNSLGKKTIYTRDSIKNLTYPNKTNALSFTYELDPKEIMIFDNYDLPIEELYKALQQRGD